MILVSLKHLLSTPKIGCMVIGCLVWFFFCFCFVFCFGLNLFFQYSRLQLFLSIPIVPATKLFTSRLYLFLHDSQLLLRYYTKDMFV